MTINPKRGKIWQVNLEPIIGQEIRIDRQQKKTDKQLKQLNKQIGGLGTKFGSFTESFIFN